MKKDEHLDYLIYKLIHSGMDLNVKLATDILSVKDQTLAPLINIVKNKHYWFSKDKNECIAPLTALHILSLTRENIALEAIIYAIYNYREQINDWFSVMPFLLANFGKESFERISQLLFDNSLEYLIKTSIAETLIIIAKSSNDIDIQKKTIDILKNAISLEKDRTAKSFLVRCLADLKDPTSIDFTKSLFEYGEIDEEITTLDEVLDVYKGHYDKNIEISYSMKDPLDYFKVNDFFSSFNTDLPQSFTFLNDEYNDFVSNEDTIDVDPVPNVDHKVVKTQAKIGRNDLCNWGSGKKYKKCCMNKSSL
jgi:hypothetical protein